MYPPLRPFPVDGRADACNAEIRGYKATISSRAQSVVDRFPSFVYKTLTLLIVCYHTIRQVSHRTKTSSVDL